MPVNVRNTLRITCRIQQFFTMANLRLLNWQLWSNDKFSEMKNAFAIFPLQLWNRWECNGSGERKGGGGRQPGKVRDRLRGNSVRLLFFSFCFLKFVSGGLHFDSQKMYKILREKSRSYAEFRLKNDSIESPMKHIQFNVNLLIPKNWRHTSRIFLVKQSGFLANNPQLSIITKGVKENL